MLGEGRQAAPHVNHTLRWSGRGPTDATEVAPKESIRLIVREVPLTHFAAGGVTLAERAGEPDPRG